MTRRLTRLLSATALAAAAITAATPAAAQSDPYLGQIMCGIWNFTPYGWLPLNGQLLPIQQNTALFSLIGTTYGGNGTTNFALPDMRGRFLMGVGAGAGLTSRALGEIGGAESVSLTTANLPPHAHTVAPLASNNDANAISPTGKVPATKARTTLYTDATNTTTMASSNTSVVGGGTAVNKVPPYVTVNCVIAAVGVYPTRP